MNPARPVILAVQRGIPQEVCQLGAIVRRNHCGFGQKISKYEYMSLTLIADAYEHGNADPRRELEGRITREQPVPHDHRIVKTEFPSE